MAINDKHTKIINQLFKGNLGKESQIQNDSILAIMLRQDAIIDSMTLTQRGKYDKNIEPYLKFTNVVKNNAIDNYKAKMSIIGKRSIFDPIEPEVVDEPKQDLIN